MSPAVPEVQRNSTVVSAHKTDSEQEARPKKTKLPALRGVEFWLVRMAITVCAIALCYALEPAGLRGLPAIVLGCLLASAILLTEARLRRAGTSGLLGGVFGVVLGMFAALLVTLVISRTSEPATTKSFLEYASLFAFAYLGLMLGSERGGEINASTVAKIMSGEVPAPEPMKLLDTSVLIDGRIADVCEAHFLDGPLGVPQFVLHELQLVADSADSLKRQRGRRGLEVLQRMQKMPHADVRILEEESSPPGDVDHKLVELALRCGAKIVTNDFNLNKVATVRGLNVLNVNQLANALKPVVLPGEPMRVLILREGKEPNQGVAYLDDGTMVVVDGGRRMINKSVDILVTSVHQTTAGKMIFGRLDERQEQHAPQMKAAAAAVSRSDGGSPPRADFPGQAETDPHLPDSPQFERGQRTGLPERNRD